MVNTLSNIIRNAVSELVRSGISKYEANAEVQILIEHFLNLTKKDLILFPDKILSSDALNEFNQKLKKRIEDKIPVQYLINKVHFMGFDFYVDENALIPRPETEILIQRAVELIEKFNNPLIIDVGTGSGCIPCSIAKLSGLSKIFACDVSEKAINVAKKNAENLGVLSKIEFVQSDLLDNVDEKFDVIISNPPYIPLSEKESLQEEVRMHEPHLALFAEDREGIIFYKKIIDQCDKKLKKGGFVCFELGINQAQAVKEYFLANFFTNIEIIKDFNGIERVILAQK